MTEWFFQKKRILISASVLVLFGMGLLIWWQFTITRTSEIPKSTIPVVAAAGTSSKQNDASKVSHRRSAETNIIDVKGGVYHPGVYRFSTPPIVADVIAKAGGCLPEVDQNRLNLAAEMSNGAVLFVPVGNQQVPEDFPMPGKVPMGSTIQAKSELVNLNTADAKDLTILPGIGQKRAEDIISTREELGGFKDVVDLKEVSGIGDKTFEKLAPLVSVN